MTTTGSVRGSASGPATAIADLTTTGDDRAAEALFREAKRRRRRRRLMGFSVVALAVAGLGYLANTRTTSHASSALPKPVAKAPVPRARTSVAVRPASLTPRQPYGLAVAPDGTLYVVDVGRDQVLTRLADGKFKVVAGNGHYGRSGDGGPATKAELRLQYSSGIVVANNGTLYIADSGNRQVRAVLPNGTIETVAGDGKDGLLVGASPALSASIGSPAGVAIGPDGDLYIAANNILRLTPAGTLDWVAGTRVGLPACGSIYCNPAGESDFLGPGNLAFDAAGDLFVSDGNGFGLYEIAAHGALSYLGQFRGDGAPGALATAPDGTVIEAWRDGLTRLIRQEPTPRAPVGTDIAAHDLGDDAKLDATLGRDGKFKNGFIGGDGVAVGRNGDIYLDTNTGNGFTSVSAVVQISPDGQVKSLWRS